MAIDNTPPRLKLIVTIGVIVLITLVAVNFALVSYFAIMTDTAAREKIAPTTDRNEQEKAEEAAFANAAMPLGKAMEALAKGARPEAIAPRQSDDVGAMTGWIKLPKPAPEPEPAAPAPAEGDADAADADAGTTPSATDPAPAPAPAPPRATEPTPAPPPAPAPNVAPTPPASPEGTPSGQPAAPAEPGAGPNEQ